MKTNLFVLAVSLAVLLAACGQQESHTPAAPGAVDVPAATPAPAMAENTQGKTVFNKTCAMCHTTGAAGAPKPGDHADWEPRIAQGKDVLYKHALEGFTGSKGVMPPRGGASTLTDDEVRAAVDYMTAQ